VPLETDGRRNTTRVSTCGDHRPSRGLRVCANHVCRGVRRFCVRLRLRNCRVLCAGRSADRWKSAHLSVFDSRLQYGTLVVNICKDHFQLSRLFGLCRVTHKIDSGVKIPCLDILGIQLIRRLRFSVDPTPRARVCPSPHPRRADLSRVRCFRSSTSTGRRRSHSSAPHRFGKGVKHNGG